MIVDRRPGCCGDARRWAPVLAALLVWGVGVAPAGEWYAVCEQSTGAVVVREDRGGEDDQVLAGPMPGPRTARLWLEENCPSRRCDGAARCGARETPPPTAAGQGGGWELGELSSTTLGGAPPIGSGGGSTQMGGPVSVAGPGAADLRPLIATATAAAAACNFPAALASADHLTNFDPGHPWLAQNHATLRRLAGRQKTTEEAVWRASSLLAAGKLEQAHQAAGRAADEAVSCQSAAVSELVRGIDDAVLQQRAARDAARRQAAAALLPGLVDLARVIGGGQAAASPSVVATSIRGAVANQLLTTYGDPCAFQLRYADPTVVAPTCTCTGYRFDPGSFRCVSP